MPSIRNVSVYDSESWALVWESPVHGEFHQDVRVAEDAYNWPGPTPFAWTPSGKNFVRASQAGSRPSMLEIRTLASPQAIVEYAFDWTGGPRAPITVLSESLVLIPGVAEKVTLVDVANHSAVMLSDVFPADPYSSPSGKYLATHTPGGFVGVWDVAASEQPVFTDRWEGVQGLSVCSSLAFSLDDKWLAATRISAGHPRRAQIGLWDLQTKQQTAEFDFDALSLRFSRDGKTLLAVSADGRLAEWETETGRPRRDVALGKGTMLHVTWSPNSQRMLAVHEGNTLRVFDVGAGQPQETIVGIEGICGPAMRVSLEGHYRMPQPTRSWQELLYVVQTADGQQTLTPEHFGREYGWKNDPSRLPVSSELLESK